MPGLERRLYFYTFTTEICQPRAGVMTGKNIKYWQQISGQYEDDVCHLSQYQLYRAWSMSLFLGPRPVIFFMWPFAMSSSSLGICRIQSKILLRATLKILAAAYWLCFLANSATSGEIFHKTRKLKSRYNETAVMWHQLMKIFPNLNAGGYARFCVSFFMSSSSIPSTYNFSSLL